MNNDFNINKEIPQPQLESLAEVTEPKTSEPAAKALNRLPGEGAQSFACFCAFAEMGPGRSYRKLAKKTGRSNSQISEWGAQYNWRARALAWDDHLWQTRNAERWRATRAEAAREAREYTASQQAHCRQDAKFSDVLMSAIARMSKYDLETRTLKTVGADGITTITTVKSPKWSLDTAAKNMKLVSDWREQWNQDRRIADEDLECEEVWNIDDYGTADPSPSPIAGDPGSLADEAFIAGEAVDAFEAISIAPPAPPAEEVAAAKTAGPTVNAGDRLPQESARAAAAFHAFLELGPGRSCRKLARNLGRETSQILDWSRKYNWMNRARAWDNHNWEAKQGERMKATKAEAERSAQEQTAREQAQRKEEEKIFEQVSDQAVRMANSVLSTMTMTEVKGPDGARSVTRLITLRFSWNTRAFYLKTALQLRQRSNRNARAMADEEQDRSQDWDMNDDDSRSQFPGQ